MKYQHQIILLLSIFLYNTSVFSQRAKSESVSSVYLTIPYYNIDKGNPNKFSNSFAMGMTNFETPKVFESKEVCVAANSKNILKSAKSIKIFKYSIPAEIQSGFLVIETQKGEVVFAEEFNSYKKTGSLVNERVNVIFGDNKCYWHPKVLESAWKKDQEDWKNKNHEKFKVSILEKAQKSAKEKFQFGYLSYSTKVFTGKGGRGNDYSDLDTAQKQAMDVYKKIANEGTITKNSIDQLMVPVKTWLKNLEQVNLKDKKAKINRKVAQGLYLNLAGAYFQILDFENAMKYLGLHGEAYTNPIYRGKDQDVINLSKLITSQQKGMGANPNLSKDFVVLNKKVKSTKKVNIVVKDLGENMANQIGAQHQFYASGAKKQAKIAASGGSIYKSNIRPGRYGPSLVMMSMFDGDLNDFPVEVTQLNVKGLTFTGGYSFTKIPAEIGNMTNLEEINLADSGISSVPDEIGKLTNLKRLDLSRTKITKLPESIKNLKNLKLLNIKKTSISADELAKIKSWLPKKCKVKS